MVIQHSTTPAPSDSEGSTLAESRAAARSLLVSSSTLRRTKQVGTHAVALFLAVVLERLVSVFLSTVVDNTDTALGASVSLQWTTPTAPLLRYTRLGNPSSKQ